MSASAMSADADLEAGETEDLDEDAELDLPDDLDDPKEDKDL